jgi:hypothetical protein
MVPVLSAVAEGWVVGGVDVLGEEELPPQPLMVIVTPLSMASMAASVNSRRSSIGSRMGSVFINSPRQIKPSDQSKPEQGACRPARPWIGARPGLARGDGFPLR